MRYAQSNAESPVPDLAGAADAVDVGRAQHDPHAFAPLYSRYLDPIFRYCYRRLGDRAAAEDATSQIFARALAALPRFRPTAGGFRAWLFAIAHNVVVDAYRADERSGATYVPLESSAELVAGELSPEAAAIRAETAHDLRAILAQLPPEQRAIVELRLAGLTGPEISAILGKRHGAVKVAQFRAFARLRGLLAERFPEHASSLEEHPNADARRA